MFHLGPIAVGSIDEWTPSPGSAIFWHPSPASLTTAREAPVSAVPVSYMQAQHLRGYREQLARGLDYSRLLVFSCDVPGRCDIGAITYLVNSHLRRHDTYRSWFEYNDASDIVRHTIRDPLDIDFVPTKHGELTTAELRDQIMATPNPLQWDCFAFGVIQGEDHFTFCASIDHLHVDAAIVGVMHVEFYLMYAALAEGDIPITLPGPGSYDDHCARQRRLTSALTLESPQVRTWIDFAENNDGSLPDFPLPLGDPLKRCGSDQLAVTLMDEQQTAQFESSCIAAGARFIGGVLACTALAEHELTGAETYYGLTPIDVRSARADLTAQGWFTGLIPITVGIAGVSFGEAARTAQASFDSGMDLAHVPYYRVLELAPWLSWPRPNYPVVNYFDAGVAPLSTFLTAGLNDANAGLYSDGRYSYQLCIYVFRDDARTTMMVMFPDNAIAKASVARYVATMKSVYARVADGRHRQCVA